ncbi:unnamed protein product, partial [Amoebophrya sp. A120]
WAKAAAKHQVGERKAEEQQWQGYAPGATALPDPWPTQQESTLQLPFPVGEISSLGIGDATRSSVGCNDGR